VSDGPGRTVHSRGADESLAHKVRFLLAVPIGSVLALDTTRRPWHGREPFWAKFAAAEMQRLAPEIRKLPPRALRTPLLS
jgi:hypothetical protein